jgi:hypothetical protein
MAKYTVQHISIHMESLKYLLIVYILWLEPEQNYTTIIIIAIIIASKKFFSRELKYYDKVYSKNEYTIFYNNENCTIITYKN